MYKKLICYYCALIFSISSSSHIEGQVTLLDQQIVDYVYNRAYDIMLRDNRLDIVLDGHPISRMTSQVDSVIFLINNILNDDITWQLPEIIGTIELRNAIPLNNQYFFNKTEIQNSGLIKKSSQIDISKYHYSLDIVNEIEFSDIFSYEKILLFRGKMTNYIKNEPLYSFVNILFVVELCDTNIPVFRNGFISLGANENYELIYHTVSFNDRECDHK